MTSDEMRAAAADKAAVMIAFSQGKEIEMQTPGTKGWSLVGDPVWNWGRAEYRVKPEPTYRPFNADEIEKRIGQQVKHKNIPGVYVLTGCKDGTVWVTDMRAKRICDFSLLGFTKEVLLCGLTLSVLIVAKAMCASSSIRAITRLPRAFCIGIRLTKKGR